MSDWNEGPPPHDVWVEARWRCDSGFVVFEAKAIYGSDGVLPHWQMRDGSVCGPAMFKLWRHIDGRKLEPERWLIASQETTVTRDGSKVTIHCLTEESAKQVEQFLHGEPQETVW